MKRCSVTLGFLCVMAVVSADNLGGVNTTEATAGELATTSSRSIREEPEAPPSWLDEVIVNECQVDSLPKSPGLKNIARLNMQSFFFRPGPSFRQVTFRMRLDAVLTSSPSFVVDGEIVFTKKELPVARTNATSDDEEPSWFPVDVEDYRQVKKYGRDRLALRVTIAGISKTLVSDYWWRLNRYEGFELSAEGMSQWAFSCDPRGVHEDMTDAPARFGAPNSWWWVIGSGLLLISAVLFFLVLLVARSACICQPLQKRGNGAPRSSPPPVPNCSRPHGVVNPFIIDTENIYEDIPLNSPGSPPLPSYSTYLSATKESKIPKSPQHLAKKKSFYAFMMEKNPWFSGASREPETHRSAGNVYELQSVGSSREVTPAAKVPESPYVDMNQGNGQTRTWPISQKYGESPAPDGDQVAPGKQPEALAHYANVPHSLR